MLATLLKGKKMFIKYVMIVFLLLSFLVLFFSVLLQYKSNEVERESVINSEQNLLKIENNVVSNRINKISSDLLYLLDSFQLEDQGDGNYSKQEQQFLAFSSRKKLYNQIRFIDVEGNEVIRVNYKDNRATLVEQSELQNKQSRDYFQETIRLEQDQIYISRLELNIENKKIIEEDNPVIRISTPYYVDEELQGMIILNYSANDIFNQIRQVASISHGQIFMLDSQAYWLYNSHNRDKEWGFMYENRTNHKFSKEFPTEWEKMHTDESGYQVSKAGLFIYTSVAPSRLFRQTNTTHTYVSSLEDWLLVSYVPAQSQKGMLFSQDIWLLSLNSLKKNYYFYIIILLIAIAIAALIVTNKSKIEEIKYFSEYDVMTGVYNRRAGFHKLAQLYKKSADKPVHHSVCFIDINGLKEVNDALGHETGDELIRSVVEGIKKNIRANDFISRLGGDEFLILFENLNAYEAEKVWQRIVKYYESINKNEGRPYLIGVSHGIESFKFDANQYIDAIINSADEKMYHEKRVVKKEMQVLREY